MEKKNEEKRARGRLAFRSGIAAALLALFACGTTEQAVPAEPVASTPEPASEPAPAPAAAEPDPSPIAPQPTGLQRFLAKQRLPRDASRREHERQLAKWPGWKLHESEHWLLATPLDDPEFVGDALRRLEVVLARLALEFPPDVPGEGTIPAPETLVLLFEKESEYHEYGGPTGSSAYYWQQTGEMVLYDERMGGGMRSTWSSLQHITVHEYFCDRLGFGATPPQWLLFGTAGLYEGMLLEGGELRIDHFDRKLERLRELAREEALLPLEALLSFDRGEFLGENEYRSPAYANLVQAWALIYYLRTGHPERTGWREEYRAIPRRFVEGWQSSGSLERARERAFEGIDLRALEASWRGWAEELARGLTR